MHLETCFFNTFFLKKENEENGLFILHSSVPPFHVVVRSKLEFTSYLVASIQALFLLLSISETSWGLGPMFVLALLGKPLFCSLKDLSSGPISINPYWTHLYFSASHTVPLTLWICLRISHLHITAENTVKGERKDFFFAVQAVYISAKGGSFSILKSSPFLLLAFSLLQVRQGSESSSEKLQIVVHTK